MLLAANEIIQSDTVIDRKEAKFRKYDLLFQVQLIVNEFKYSLPVQDFINYFDGDKLHQMHFV